MLRGSRMELGWWRGRGIWWGGADSWGPRWGTGNRRFLNAFRPALQWLLSCLTGGGAGINQQTQTRCRLCPCGCSYAALRTSATSVFPSLLPPLSLSPGVSFPPHLCLSVPPLLLCLPESPPYLCSSLSSLMLRIVIYFFCLVRLPSTLERRFFFKLHSLLCP